MVGNLDLFGGETLESQLGKPEQSQGLYSPTTEVGEL